MKRIFLVLSLVGAFAWVNAQSGEKELRNAYTNYANKYYDKALRSIQKALVAEDTKNEAKTWFYYGNICLQIINANNDYYKKMLPNAEIEAYNAYLKALELDANIDVPNMGIKNPRAGLAILSNNLYNMAYNYLLQNNADSAFIIAGMARKAYTSENTIFMHGYTAQFAKKDDVVKKEFAQLVKNKYKVNIIPYTGLANAYQNSNDTAKAIRVMEEAMKVFADDTNYHRVASSASIVYSWAGMDDKATEIMENALQKNPNDITLLVNYGSALIGQHKYDEAEKYLQRAISINSEDYTINYNMGSCYFNKYADLTKEIGKIDDDEEYEKAKAQSEELLQKARPYLEKAQSMISNDYNTLYMLRQVYTRTNEMEKLKEVNAKMEELKNNQ